MSFTNPRSELFNKLKTGLRGKKCLVDSSLWNIYMLLLRRSGMTGGPGTPVEFPLQVFFTFSSLPLHELGAWKFDVLPSNVSNAFSMSQEIFHNVSQTQSSWICKIGLDQWASGHVTNFKDNTLCTLSFSTTFHFFYLYGTHLNPCGLTKYLFHLLCI